MSLPVLLPTPFHLPGDRDAAPWSAWRALGTTPLQVPVLRAVEIERVWSRLDAAADAWRAVQLATRVECLATALHDLRARGPGRWRDALAHSAVLSLAGIDAAWDATFAPHDAAALRAALACEGIDAAALAALDGARRLPHRLVHVMAGNVLAPTLQTLLRGWLLGGAQWLRPAAREPLFAACLLTEMEALVPEAAACTAVLWWPHGDAMQAAVLAAADAVTVHGSDAAVAAIRDGIGVGALPCIGYEARWSAALVSKAAQTPATAAGLAQDVALFDQQGCLSPTLVFAEDGPGLRDWCAVLAAALAAAEARMPRGPVDAVAAAALRHWQECVRLDVALGTVCALWEDGTRWAVALLERCASYATPLDRHLVVVPFANAAAIPAAIGPVAARLQGLAVAVEGWDAARIDAALTALRPSRTAAPGSLHLAPLAWPQDHRPPFASLLRPAGAGERGRLNAPSD